ncbi:acetylxylan esterase [Streptomyces sp. NPDC086989]|uniref:acetylxylan esterase n=1 Tax=Streptomyces sp. NPDC086989 TaxID=3365764 RepID=UPI003817C5D4
MPLTDLEAEELGDRRPHLSEPADFDAFCRRTLAGARSHDASITAERVSAQHPLSTVEADDGRLPTPDPSPVAAGIALGGGSGGRSRPGRWSGARRRPSRQRPSRRGPRGGGHAGRPVPVPPPPRCRDLLRRPVPGDRHGSRRRSPHREQPAFATLDHFDGVHFARRAPTPTPFGVGLTDPAWPPSTVCAAFNQSAGRDRSTTVWPFGDHGGDGSPPPVQPARLRGRGLAHEL